MSVRQKKKVTFKDLQDNENKYNEPLQFDYNINYLILKYKSLIKKSEKDMVYWISDLSRHYCEYNLDIQRYYNDINDHVIYIESMKADMEYHIALHIQKNDPRVEKKKEKNKFIIDNRNKNLEYHKIKTNIKIADVYCSFVYHKVQTYSKISKLLNDLHHEMNNEYIELQKLFDESKCKLREEWQDYIKPYIDLQFDIFNKKEMYEGYFNASSLEKIKANDYYFNFMKQLQEFNL
jgi:hypothetical protein